MDKKDLLIIIFILIGGALNGTTFILEHQDKEKSRKTAKYKLQQIKNDFISKNNNHKQHDFPIIKYAILDSEEKALLELPNRLKNNKQIYEFYQKIAKNVSINDLKNFLVNSQTVQIDIEKLTMSQRFFEISTGKIKGGEYILNINTIKIYHSFMKSVINHELLHLASFNAQTFQAGLSYYDYKKNDIVIGRGITEGYTELLNHRYFNSKSTAYSKLKKIAELIELFYKDKENLKSDFFHANFYNLVANLTQSISYNEAISLLIDIDYLYYHQMDNKYFKDLKNNMYELYCKNHSYEENKKFKIKAKIK